MIKIGVDIGSTTVKVVAVGEDGDMLFSRYERHNADAKDVVKGILETLKDHCGDVEAGVRMTGSVGMGFAEWLGLPFVQEVVAATKAVQTYRPDTVSMIDIGGEDAKVVFFREGRAVDLRMNGNCAGGTGAFIDQMAVLLGVGVGELDSLAAEAKQTYPIASRCGVFCKTDIQNLIAKNVSRADIAASILHAVAVQTVVTLAHGCEIKPPVLVCGGPLTFIPSLRKAFKDYLSLSDDDIILPEHGTLLPALGAALTDVDDERPHRLSDVIADVAAGRQPTDGTTHALTPIFGGDEEHESWKKRMSGHARVPGRQAPAPPARSARPCRQTPRRRLHGQPCAKTPGRNPSDKAVTRRQPAQDNRGCARLRDRPAGKTPAQTGRRPGSARAEWLRRKKRPVHGHACFDTAYRFPFQLS